MLPKDFWLYQWLDSYLVRSPQQAMKLLHEPGTIPSLMQAAIESAAIRSDVDQDIGFPLSPAPVLTSQVKWLARISPTLRSRSTSFQIGLADCTACSLTLCIKRICYPS
jgi:hypothetical protein